MESGGAETPACCLAGIASIPVERSGPAEYGDGCASFYDQLYPSIETGLLTRLAELARGGAALELGIATGRVALPLQRMGVDITGIDASRAMLAKLRARARGADVRLVLGDFVHLPFQGAFELIFVLCSTLHLLTSRQLQAQCLRSVAKALSPTGVFVSEAFAEANSEDRIRLAEHSIETSLGPRTYRVATLAISVNVLDRLAADAGLDCVARWSSWLGAPCDDRSLRHISVYRLARGVARHAIEP